MQGKGPSVQPALNRLPKSEDLQKLLRTVQSGGAQVQQPINLDSGKRFLLKVQPARSASGLGKSKSASAFPLWSLIDGVTTVWEYNTADIELIFNLVEEAVYASSSHSGPIEDKSAAAMAVLEEMAAAHGVSNIGFGGAEQKDPYTAPQAGQVAPSANYAAMQGPQFSGETSGQFSSGGSGQLSSGGGGQFDSGAGGQFDSGAGGQFNSETSGQFRAPSHSQPALAVAGAPQQGMPLSGNLSELGLCDLFQSISVAKMTGRLDVTSGLESLEVYFEDGAPRRASFRSDSMTGAPRDITGEEVLLEGMTWKNGFFQFNTALKSNERSPMRRLDLLLMEGAALKDYLDALENAGLTAESMPVRLAQLSEADFEKALTAGIPVNLQHQKSIYVAFDGKATLSDITRGCGLPKSIWLPLVFNLLNCGLIGLAVKAQAQSASSEAPQSPLVKEAVQEAFQELLRPDTGLTSYPLFMHFMEVEFQRALRLRLPFSLIVISVHKEGSCVKEQLSSDDLKLVAEKTRAYLEPYDHLGHYQTLDIGILLPHRPGAQAREYAKKIVDDFNRELAASNNQVRFVWSVGIGCIPEDGIKLSAMVAKAEKERNSARDSMQAVV